MTVIVNDGSDQSFLVGDIKKELGEGFPVVVLANEVNEGITSALNKGLKWIDDNADTRYIARLDCGDLCHPERFQQQVSYLDANEETGLLGTWCRFEEKGTGKGYVYKTPTLHADIIRAMHVRNVFIHPTVMFRKELLNLIGYYPSDFEHAEDYAYFWEMIRVRKSSIIDQVLVICELNSRGISSANRRKQIAARWKVVRAFGQNQFLRIWGFLRLKLLLLVPNSVLLQIKQRKQ